ncbi:hypothetical protein G6F59_015568 [Rhizopus arrhizus]|nr:hypothetical protein G6F59_015568 [Rhizopus arrhizus]
MRICLGTALVLARLAQQQDPATQLAAVLLDVFGLLDLDLHQFAFHRAVRTRRPGLGQRLQRLDAVAQHFHAGRGELPATAEIIEGFVVDVVQLPFVELAAGPGLKVSITCERWKASWRMRLTMSRSTVSRCCAPALPPIASATASTPHFSPLHFNTPHPCPSARSSTRRV